METFSSFARNLKWSSSSSVEAENCHFDQMMRWWWWRKSQGSLNSFGYIIWEPCISFKHFNAIYKIVLEIIHPGKNWLKLPSPKLYNWVHKTNDLLLVWVEEELEAQVTDELSLNSSVWTFLPITVAETTNFKYTDFIWWDWIFPCSNTGCKAMSCLLMHRCLCWCLWSVAEDMEKHFINLGVTRKNP